MRRTLATLLAWRPVPTGFTILKRMLAKAAGTAFALLATGRFAFIL
jgi:hypothetical protein